MYVLLVHIFNWLATSAISKFIVYMRLKDTKMLKNPNMIRNEEYSSLTV